MKILIVHNDYGKPSGEESVVERMKALFMQQGMDVFEYRCSSEILTGVKGKIRGFISGIYSHSGVKGLREAIRIYQPDIINVHNLYPLISPAALFECRKQKIPVVMTVHNYRLICPTGLFMRKGVPCEACLVSGCELNCIRFNCEKSFAKSIGYAIRNYVARKSGAYRKNVSVFACLTDFQRSKLIEAGFERDKIVVIPNSIEVPSQHTFSEGKYIGYAGRLSYEKGFDRLVKIARLHPELNFQFAGEIRGDMAGDIPENVKFLGQLDQKSLDSFFRNAKFLVIPSRCYEGFPMVILEAAGWCKPVICPEHGGFTEIVGKEINSIGRLFNPNDEDDLEKQILYLWNSPEEVKELGERAYQKLQTGYSSEIIVKKWMELIGCLVNSGRSFENTLQRKVQQ